MRIVDRIDCSTIMSIRFWNWTDVLHTNCLNGLYSHSLWELCVVTVLERKNNRRHHQFHHRAPMEVDVIASVNECRPNFGYTPDVVD